MEKQKSYWAGNVKFLRVREKISQDEMSQILGITRAKLAAHETGTTKNPTVQDLMAVSAHFKLSIDTLLKVNLAIVGEMKIRQLQAGNDEYMTGTNLRILPITVDKQNKENGEYVPIKAKAGYQAGYSDPSYIKELPKLGLPNLPLGKTYRMFPTEGDSMLPIPEGSEIVTTYIENWKEIKPGTLCIVILKGNQDFVFKKVTVQEDNSFLLSSLNPIYDPYTVSAEHVMELWKYYSYYSKDIPVVGENAEMSRMISEIYQSIVVTRNEK